MVEENEIGDEHRTCRPFTEIHSSESQGRSPFKRGFLGLTLFSEMDRNFLSVCFVLAHYHPDETSEVHKHIVYSY